MFPQNFSFSHSVGSAYYSYYRHCPASYQPCLPPLRYSIPHELGGTPRRHRDGEPTLLTSEMGPRVLSIYCADCTESCYMETLQEEIDGVLGRMESLHKIEGAAALSYLVSKLVCPKGVV